jgi:hypothetical protein
VGDRLLKEEIWNAYNVFTESVNNT